MSEPTEPIAPCEPKVTHPAAVSVYADNALVGIFEDEDGCVRFQRFKRNADGDLQIERLD